MEAMKAAMKAVEVKVMKNEEAMQAMKEAVVLLEAAVQPSGSPSVSALAAQVLVGEAEQLRAMAGACINQCCISR